TEFRADHFRATCRVAKPEDSVEAPPPAASGSGRRIADLDPASDLYGDLLFHSGRFRRLAGYRTLRAMECVAEIDSPEGPPSWFGAYLPPELLLGDPAARDAAIHCVQTCIPHATLLPVGVDRIVLTAHDPPGGRIVHARER